MLVHDTVSDTAKEREAGIKNELATNHPNVTVTGTIYLDQLEMLKKQIVAEQVGVTPEELAYPEKQEKERKRQQEQVMLPRQLQMRHRMRILHQQTKVRMRQHRKWTMNCPRRCGRSTMTRQR